MPEVEVAIGVQSDEAKEVGRQLLALGFEYIETAPSPEGTGDSDEYHGYDCKFFVDHTTRLPCVYFGLPLDEDIDAHYQRAVDNGVSIVLPITTHGPYREYMARVGDQLNIMFWQRPE